MKLKTFKDIICDDLGCCPIDCPGKLREEAIKWIKEDFELVKNIESHKILDRWKERFNITEEDLK